MLHVFCGVFFKESIKTRSCMLLLLAGSLLFLGRLWLEIRRLFLLDHPEIVWYRVMDLGQIPHDSLTLVPVLCACIFCCCQFLPEMRDERLRISLHLPCGTAPLVLAHLLYGLCFLTLLYGLLGLGLVLILRVFFPPESVVQALLACLPWFLAGLYAYLCTACVLLEPGRRARLLGVQLGAGLCTPLLLKAAPGSFAPVLPFFILGLPLLLVGLLLPALHFRHRRAQ